MSPEAILMGSAAGLGDRRQVGQNPLAVVGMDALFPERRV
jgi:hypothetical protein